MEVSTPYYIYDGKFWIPVPTISDNDSFFHSTFGFRDKEDEPYIDKYAADKRRDWSDFLTTSEIKSMPPNLIDILRKCFSANKKYKHASVDDKIQLAKYASDIEAAQEPVTLEEIQFLAAFHNYKIVLLSKSRSDVVVEPDLGILGLSRRRAFVDNFRKVKNEVVLSFEEDRFCKLVVADEISTKRYQVDYLLSYWMCKLNLEDSVKDKCERYAKTLLSRTFTWMKICHHLKSHFSDVWLQMTMLAEIFQQNNLPGKTSNWEGCKEYLGVDTEEPKLPENMNLVKLFDMFVTKKRNSFMDTENCDGENQTLMDEFEECLKRHRILALESVLDKAKCTLFVSYEQSNENFETNLSKLGIVNKSNEKFHFVHNTFKEYFFAEILLRELRLPNEKADFQRFLFEEILSCSEFHVTRAFMDCRLQTTDPIPSNILYNFQSMKCDIDFKKQHLQCTIHLLAKEGCVAVLQLLLKCIHFQPVGGKKIKLACVFETKFDKDTWKDILGNSLNLLRYLARQAGINIKDKEDNTPLHYAAKQGHFAMVKFLVEQGANVHDPGSESQTALHLSALEGHLNTVKFLVESGANVEQTTSKGSRALYVAVSGGHFDSVKFLVENGGKINVLNYDGLSALHVAAKGQMEVVRFLVEHGGDVNVRANDGPTPLHLALSENHMDIVEYILDFGANININYKGCTPLHIAASKGVNGVKLLVERGAYLDAIDKDGSTPLHLAVSEKHLDAVKFLLQNGANSNIKNDRGNAPLHLAVFYENGIELVKCLIENKADINIKDKDGCTALYLTMLRDHTNTAKHLLEHGGNINITNNEGYSALHFAVHINSLDNVKFLVEQGADVNTRDGDGPTTLQVAVTENNLDIVKLLIEKGANVTARDNEGSTALHLAAREGRLDIVNVLAKCGNVNIRDREDETALHAAVNNDYLEIVKTLVQNGADVNILNIDNETPLYSAVSRNEINIIKLLEENGAQADFKRTKNCSTVLHFAALKCQIVTFKYFMERDPGFNITGSDGTTALLLAAKGGRTNTVRFLVEHGVDINSTRDDGRTALHLAAKSYDLDTIEFLVKAGADVNVRDNDGRTSLHMAAKSSLQSVVEFFIKRVRDVNEKDDQGRTALHLATLKNRLSNVEALVEAGVDVRVKDNDGFTALHLATLWCPFRTDLIRYLEPQSRTRKRRLND